MPKSSRIAEALGESPQGDSPSRVDEFVRLLAEHQFGLYAYILSLLSNCADADDVMQETSVALWEMFDSYESGTDFRAWACRVAYYRVLKFRERCQGTPFAVSDEFLDRVAAVSFERHDELEHRRQALIECMKKLRDRDRELLEHRYDASQPTLKRIAELVGRPVNTVYKAMSRIHRTLFECVQRRLAQEKTA